MPRRHVAGVACFQLVVQALHIYTHFDSYGEAKLFLQCVYRYTDERNSVLWRKIGQKSYFSRAYICVGPGVIAFCSAKLCKKAILVVRISIYRRAQGRRLRRPQCPPLPPRQLPPRQPTFQQPRPRWAPGLPFCQAPHVPKGPPTPSAATATSPSSWLACGLGVSRQVVLNKAGSVVPLVPPRKAHVLVRGLCGSAEAVLGMQRRVLQGPRLGSSLDCTKSSR